MHHEFYTFFMCIFIKIFDIKVRIWRHKIKHIFLPMAKPVFPTDVPSFDKYLLKSVLCGKIDVTFHVGCVRRMKSIRLHVRVICLTNMHRREVKSVTPWLTTSYHFPPNSTIFCRVNPAGIGQLTRLVEIQNEVTCQHLTGIIADNHRALRRIKGCLHIGFIAYCVGR